MCFFALIVYPATIMLTYSVKFMTVVIMVSSGLGVACASATAIIFSTTFQVFMSAFICPVMVIGVMWVVMRHEVLFAILTLATTRAMRGTITCEFTSVIVLVNAIATRVVATSITTSAATSTTTAAFAALTTMAAFAAFSTASTTSRTTTSTTAVFAFETEAIRAVVIMRTAAASVVLTHASTHGASRAERPSVLHTSIPMQVIYDSESLNFMCGRFAWDWEPSRNQFPLKLSTTLFVELLSFIPLLDFFILSMLLHDIFQCHLVMLSHWLWTAAATASLTTAATPAAATGSFAGSSSCTSLHSCSSFVNFREWYF